MLEVVTLNGLWEPEAVHTDLQESRTGMADVIIISTLGLITLHLKLKFCNCQHATRLIASARRICYDFETSDQRPLH